MKYNKLVIAYRMQRLRNQYEKYITPHFFAQSHKMYKQQKDTKNKIIKQHQKDLIYYIDLHENSPQSTILNTFSLASHLKTYFTVKSLRKFEEILKTSESQSEHIMTEIKLLQHRKSTIYTKLLDSQQKFIIAMINIGIKEAEINEKVSLFVVTNFFVVTHFFVVIRVQ